MIEQHIEELHAEVQNVLDLDEYREIKLKLEIACAELAIIMAEQDGAIGAVPPF